MKSEAEPTLWQVHSSGAHNLRAEKESAASPILSSAWGMSEEPPRVVCQARVTRLVSIWNPKAIELKCFYPKHQFISNTAISCVKRKDFWAMFFFIHLQLDKEKG